MAFVYWLHLKEHTDILKEGYVGITSRTVKQRFNQHKTTKTHRNEHLQKVFREDADVIVTTICECSIEYAGELESKLRPFERIGWNIAAGGNTVSMTEEGKRRVSIALKGRKKPQHVMDAMNTARLLKPISDESRLKWSIAATGRFWDQAQKDKLSASRKGVSQIRARSSTEAAIQTFADKHPLDLTHLNKEAWLMCDLYYAEFLKGNSKFVANRIVPNSNGGLVAMWKRFKLGFNPLVDERWLAWKAASTDTTEPQQP